MDFTELYCAIDDFIKKISSTEQKKMTGKGKRRGFTPFLSLGEIMTIVVGYHQSSFKNFKSYFQHLHCYHQKDFPKITSYNRFVELMSQSLLPLCFYLESKKGEVTGINFVDSTSLSVCKNIRISRNKVFKDIATRGKSSMGWFFGFKLHLVVNQFGELLAFHITKGNINDRVPVEKLCRNLWGKLFADKGYIDSKLFKKLW